MHMIHAGDKVMVWKLVSGGQRGFWGSERPPGENEHHEEMGTWPVASRHCQDGLRERVSRVNVNRQSLYTLTYIHHLL